MINFDPTETRKKGGGYQVRCRWCGTWLYSCPEDARDPECMCCQEVYRNVVYNKELVLRMIAFAVSGRMSYDDEITADLYARIRAAVPPAEYADAEVLSGPAW
jgi:hypothetical protein